ncbi:cyclophilin-like fold protein [Schaedlerella sp.]|uniref:cyclophilin-like fold protein n=1 Tax=Schaedlerella sp. TaxID=2676057 RepID=UPI00374A2D7E
MRKFYTVLYLAIILSCMAACGKNDTQAQTPGRQAELSTIESSSQSDSLSNSKNADESSVAMDSTKTADETMSENTIVDESENVAKPMEDANEAESVQETERNEMDTAETDIQNNMEENKVANMNVQVGDVVFSATLEENEAVSALVEMMRESPVVIQMSDYSGFEKVGSLGIRLPASNSQTTTQAGDIVLYNGNQIVIFYGSNSWSYTRLGHIDDLTGWEDALGSGDVTVIFSLE